MTSCQALGLQGLERRMPVIRSPSLSYGPFCPDKRADVVASTPMRAEGIIPNCLRDARSGYT
jgi:hypothetical protein